MTPLTQALRDEHKELLLHKELLRTVADDLGDVPIALLRRSVDEAYAFLMHHLLPHAQAEERALVSVHFAKEEGIYLPLLDARLTAEEAAQMFAAMERATQETRGLVG